MVPVSLERPCFDGEVHPPTTSEGSSLPPAQACGHGLGDSADVKGTTAGVCGSECRSFVPLRKLDVHDPIRRYDQDRAAMHGWSNNYGFDMARYRSNYQVGCPDPSRAQHPLHQKSGLNDHRTSQITITLPEQADVQEIHYSWKGELVNVDLLVKEGIELLKCTKGERVEILQPASTKDGWSYGRIKGAPERQGWFPQYLTLHPVKMLEKLNTGPSSPSEYISDGQNIGAGYQPHQYNTLHAPIINEVTNVQHQQPHRVGGPSRNDRGEVVGQRYGPEMCLGWSHSRVFSPLMAS